MEERSSLWFDVSQTKFQVDVNPAGECTIFCKESSISECRRCFLPFPGASMITPAV